MAEFYKAPRTGQYRRKGGQEPLYAAARGEKQTQRFPPGPCLSGRAKTDRAPVLHELCFLEIHSQGGPRKRGLRTVFEALRGEKAIIRFDAEKKSISHWKSKAEVPGPLPLPWTPNSQFENPCISTDKSHMKTGLFKIIYNRIGFLGL